MHSSTGDKSVMVGNHVNAFYFKNTPRLLHIVFGKFIFAIKLFKYIIAVELMPYVNDALSSGVFGIFPSRLS
jgi:hypothetical protein